MNSQSKSAMMLGALAGLGVFDPFTGLDIFDPSAGLDIFDPSAVKATPPPAAKDMKIPTHGEPGSFIAANPEHRKAKKNRLKRKRTRKNKRGY